ncbi:MAG: site-specific DNA-methyltransferase, partial [Candidatus Gastranaerophilales bacterium]|nr:site-specific DNA-methyltransferase [Candidatus Gastranaerophilales bacterium]
LFLGENISILKTLLSYYKNKIDLIYIDPPFSTNNVFRIGERTSTVSCDNNDDIAYTDNLKGEEFLEFIRERLLYAKELLSDKGSIYLHIDYKIGHYVKIVMDEVFGIENFRNDITRVKCNPKNFDRIAYGNIKDMILFYSKSSKPIWNNPMTPYTEDDIKKLFKKTDKDGRRYTTIPLHAPGETKNGATSCEFMGVKPPKGRHWRCAPCELEKLNEQGLIEWSANRVPRKIIYADEKQGKKMQDIWDYKDPQYPSYPTEKNIELLKNIINASSNSDSTVLDFFCGSGTTLLAANQLGRKWIGIDASLKAIETVKERLLNENLTSFSKPFKVLEAYYIEEKKFCI